VSCMQGTAIRLHRGTIALSAFLLFLVQPMIAKRLLAPFGGSAAVWTTCLLFFQGVLVLGYLYAHTIARLTIGTQRRIHGGLLLVSLASLPWLLRGSVWGPPIVASLDADPVAALLLLLMQSAFLPYLTLASTSPLVSRWAQGFVPDAQVFKLYAFSNAASLLALVVFPFVVEPLFGTRVQLLGFASLFVLYALMIVQLLRQATPADAPKTAAAPTPVVAVDRFQHYLIPFTTGVLLVAVTQAITTQIAPVPLLWVVPLAAYLISFSVAFADQGSGLRRRVVLLVAVVMVGAGLTYLYNESDWALLSMVVTTYFLFALVLHGDLARRKPDAALLTRYYLDISLGGALGTLLCALIFPRVFSFYVETPVAFGLVVLQPGLAIFERQPQGRKRNLIGLVACVIAGGVALITAWRLNPVATARERTFYGVLMVQDRGDKRFLAHAGVTHGSQYLDGARSRVLTSYYGPGTGVSLAMRAQEQSTKQGLHVGLVGLGTGTLLRTQRAEDRYDVFEIDQGVVDMYDRFFRPLAPPAGAHAIHIGDGRLLLAQEPDASYDTLVLDAFAGDAVPVHLLTREAFALYRRKLRYPAVLAVHTSNRYLGLVPIVIRGTSNFGMTARVLDAPSTEQGQHRCRWLVLADDPHLFDGPTFAHGKGASAADFEWTDDRSSLFRAMRWGTVTPLLDLPPKP
jgi:hypothetical protein